MTEIVKEISLRTVNATELFYQKLLEKLRRRESRLWHDKRLKSRILKENKELLLRHSKIEPFEGLDEVLEESQIKSKELKLENEDFLDSSEASTNHNEIELSDSDEENE